MKVIFCIALSLISISLFAQETIMVTVDSSTASVAQHTFSVDIPQTTIKDVKNDWQKHVASGNKGKASFVNEEYIQTGVVNKNISPDPFTMYSKLMETPVGVRLTARLELNYLASSSGVANSNQDLAVQKFLQDFAIDQYRTAVKKELNIEQKKLASLEKDLSKGIKEEEKSTKNMKENDRSNERSEDAISTNNRDINNSTDKISDQKGMVNVTASDPNATKGAKKTLAELKREKRSLQKQNESQSKKIDNRNKENREEDRNIQLAQQNNETLKVAIERQKAVVEVVQVKLNNIQ